MFYNADFFKGQMSEQLQQQALERKQTFEKLIQESLDSLVFNSKLKDIFSKKQLQLHTRLVSYPSSSLLAHSQDDLSPDLLINSTLLENYFET